MKFISNNGGYGGVLEGDNLPDGIGAYGTGGIGGVAGARSGTRTGRGHLHSTRQYRPSLRNHVYPSVLEPSPYYSVGNVKPARHNISNARRLVGHLRATNKGRDDAFAYDFDGDGADDERAPLLSQIRRFRNGRRPNPASLRHLECLEHQHSSRTARFAFCATLLSVLLFISTIGTMVVVGLTRPLRGLNVTMIENVIASEQEIMLDINVEAVNLNLLPLTVSRVDINIFAQSNFIGNEGMWADLAARDDSASKPLSGGAAHARLFTRETVDEGTNPISDPDDMPADNSSTMLLGRVFDLDAPLTFDSSPWRHTPSASVGQIRLAHPGNHTEEGGSRRWERVLQHPFELILRGVVHYQLPLGDHYTSAPISGRLDVMPGTEKTA
ncbi:hypothetical protein KEM52_002321 [Ascosphaera acerosa]|nr:hypothetical protein KEM52_002321 [Ascosphaera acerosa]